MIIVNQLTKIVYYVLVKVTINAPGLAKVIIDEVVRHYGVLELIVTDQDSLFISKFWFSLYYFLEIKRKLSTAFHPQMNSQRKGKTIQ